MMEEQQQNITEDLLVPQEIYLKTVLGVRHNPEHLFLARCHLFIL